MSLRVFPTLCPQNADFFFHWKTVFRIFPVTPCLVNQFDGSWWNVGFLNTKWGITFLGSGWKVALNEWSWRVKRSRWTAVTSSFAAVWIMHELVWCLLSPSCCTAARQRRPAGVQPSCPENESQLQTLSRGAWSRGFSLMVASSLSVYLPHSPSIFLLFSLSYRVLLFGARPFLPPGFVIAPLLQSFSLPSRLLTFCQISSVKIWISAQRGFRATDWFQIKGAEEQREAASCISPGERLCIFNWFEFLR